MKIRLGTRGSDLALWQANYTADILGRENCEIIIIKTTGDVTAQTFDKIEGKGFFTKEIEDALLNNKIDVAVHSLKDLPTDEPEELTVAGIPLREVPHDVLLINKDSFDGKEPFGLKPGTVVGTSSLRRLSQIKYLNNTVAVEALRGNVPTRIRKLREGNYGAIILAGAGVKRLEIDLSDFHVVELDPEEFHPAPGQGALAYQVRRNDKETAALIEKLNDIKTVRSVKAERTFLNHFGGGCHIPLGAFAVDTGEEITLQGSVTALDGGRSVRETVRGTDPEELGRQLAEKLKAAGVSELL